MKTIKGEPTISATYVTANLSGYCVFHYSKCASRAQTKQALRSQSGSALFRA